MAGVAVESKNTQYAEHVYLSAVTNEFLGAENLVCTINFPGTGQTLYNGVQNIITDAKCRRSFSFAGNNS